MEGKRKIGYEDEEYEGYQKFKRYLEAACKDEKLINKIIRPKLRGWIEEYHSTRGEPSSWPTQSPQPETRYYELRISGELPKSIFTNNKIESVNKELLRVQLVDSRSKESVTSGPLASMKVRIVPLKGLFGEESWSASDFRANIAANRESRGDLLGGELTITLKSGVGFIKNVYFTDTSFRQRFRIGAQSMNEESSVKEAVSGAFVVKDRRGEQYQKHYPPKFNDYTWRLVGIAKDGTYDNRLTANSVNNVGDFVRLLESDPIKLRQILGRIPDGLWNQVVEHARTCEDDKEYVYIFRIEMPNPEEIFHLVFDSLYRLMGWRYNNQFTEQLINYDQQCQDLVNNLKKHAYENKDAFEKVNKFQLFGPPSSAPIVPSQPRAAASLRKWVEFRVVLKFLMVMKAAKKRSSKGNCLRTDSLGMLVVEI